MSVMLFDELLATDTDQSSPDPADLSTDDGMLDLIQEIWADAVAARAHLRTEPSRAERLLSDAIRRLDQIENELDRRIARTDSLSPTS